MVTEIRIYKLSVTERRRVSRRCYQPGDTKTKLGGIVVVHESRGLNPHIEDVAGEPPGFISIADALTPLGGYPGNDDEGRELQSKRDK
jgi:carboxymethylenebutenolidase